MNQFSITKTKTISVDQRVKTAVITSILMSVFVIASLGIFLAGSYGFPGGQGNFLLAAQETCESGTHCYYIDNKEGSNCSNTGTGSFTQPFCAITKSLTLVKNSDTIFIREGTYRLMDENPAVKWFALAGSGATSANFITIQSYSNEHVRILGSLNSSGRIWEKYNDLLWRLPADYLVYDPTGMFLGERRIEHEMKWVGEVRSHSDISQLTTSNRWTKADVNGVGCPSANSGCYIYVYPVSGEDPNSNIYEFSQRQFIFSGASYLVIRGLEFAYTQNAALTLEGGKNQLIEKNTFSHNSNSNDNAYSIFISYGGGAIVRKNRVYDSKYWGGISNSKGITLMDNDPANPATIEDNEIYDIIGQGIASKGGASDIIVRGNYVHNTGSAIQPIGFRCHWKGCNASTGGFLYPGCGWRIYDNILVDNEFGVDSSDCLGESDDHINSIFNNVIYNNSIAGILHKWLVKNSSIYNNILIKNARGIYLTNGGSDTYRTIDDFLPTFSSNYNIFYENTADYLVRHNWGGPSGSGTAYTLNQMKNYNKERNSTSVNPVFINTQNFDFHLQNGSPALDKGTIIPGFHCPVSDDVNPNQTNCRHWWGSAPDIGAFEYGAPETPVSPCFEDWSCTDWSNCDNGTRIRTCTDKNACGTVQDQPPTSEACQTTPSCMESWSCTAWSVCSQGQQTRTCVDQNSCNTVENRPIEQFDCSSGAVPPTDTIAPNTVITGGPAAIITTDQTFFAWTGNDDQTAIQDLVYTYQLDDNPWSAWSSQANLTVKRLNNGSHAFKVKARDGAGNEDPSPAALTFTVQIEQYIVAVPNQGGGPQVRVFSQDGSLQKQFFAYEKSFRGGLSVATGDLDGDGVGEIIVGPGPGRSPEIKVFRKNGTLIDSFLAYDQSFKGGVNVAVGDFDGNGQAEIVTVPMPGGGPNVRTFAFKKNSFQPITRNFMAYQSNFRGGVSIASCDLEGDGQDELITAPQSNGGPQVKIFGIRNKEFKPVTLPFMAYQPAFKGGLNLACADVNGDNRGEIITVPISRGGPQVRIFGRTGTKTIGLIHPGFFAYHPQFKGGVSLSSIDGNYDGTDEIVTGVLSNSDYLVRIFSVNGRRLLKEFYAFPRTYKGGIRISIGQ